MILLIFSLWTVESLSTPLYTAKAETTPPLYAKWGRLAVQKTKEKYPNAKIVDYLHVGRKQGANVTSEKFKLWLKTDRKEFGVFVTITFNTATEQVIGITFQETPR